MALMVERAVQSENGMAVKHNIVTTIFVHVC